MLSPLSLYCFLLSMTFSNFLDAVIYFLLNTHIIFLLRYFGCPVRSTFHNSPPYTTIFNDFDIK